MSLQVCENSIANLQRQRKRGCFRGGGAALGRRSAGAGRAQVRAGEEVDNAELVKFAQLFNDELTLDNLERVHLVNLCRFIGVAPFGTDEFLRVRLRARLAAIKARPP